MFFSEQQAVDQMTCDDPEMSDDESVSCILLSYLLLSSSMNGWTPFDSFQ